MAIRFGDPKAAGADRDLILIEYGNLTSIVGRRSGSVTVSAFGTRYSEGRRLSDVEKEFRRAEMTDLADADLAARAFARRVLSKVSDHATVAPTMTADDDGGVVLYWRAGKDAVQIDITPDEDFYVRVNNSITGETRHWVDAPFPVAQVREALRRFSGLFTETKASA